MYPKKPVKAPLKHTPITGFPDGSEIKNLPTNAGDSKDVGSIPDQEDSLE